MTFHPESISDHIHQTHRCGLNKEDLKEPFTASHQFKEPTICPGLWHDINSGRWQWGLVMTTTHRIRCTARSRVNNRRPAGVLTLSGALYRSQRKEIVRLILKTEHDVQFRHPLERIMHIEDSEEGQMTSFNFTGTRLPQRIITELKEEYQGKLDCQYLGSTGTAYAT
jgi:hypothetical protein